MLFQYFSDTFDYLIEKDKKEGKYDMGILGMEKEEWPQLCLLHPSSSQCSVPTQHRFWDPRRCFWEDVLHKSLFSFHRFSPRSG